MKEYAEKEEPAIVYRYFSGASVERVTLKNQTKESKYIYSLLFGNL